MAEQFIISGWFDYGDQRDTVLEHFVECARASRAEAGCLDYWVAADPESAALLHVFERWASEAELADHFRTDHVAAFRAAIEAIPRVARELNRYFIASTEDFQSSRPSVS